MQLSRIRLWGLLLALSLSTLGSACAPVGEPEPVEGYVYEVVATGIADVDGLGLLEDGTILATQEHDGGSVVRVDPVTGKVTPLAGSIDRADNIVVIDADHVYVTEEVGGGRVVHVDAAGNTRAFVDGLNRPEGLDLGPDGSLYVVEHASPGRLIRLRMDGSMETLAPDLRDGEGARVLPDGSVLVAETSVNRIARVSPDGTRTYLAEGALSSPDGIGYDRETGRVFVTEDESPGRLFELDPETGALDLVMGSLDAPQTMTFEADGSMLLAEQGKGRILRIREVGPPVP